VPLPCARAFFSRRMLHASSEVVLNQGMQRSSNERKRCRPQGSRWGNGDFIAKRLVNPFAC
jgi:hypothetical protein